MNKQICIFILVILSTCRCVEFSDTNVTVTEINKWYDIHSVQLH